MKILGSRFLMAAGLAGAAGLLLNVNCGGSSGGGTGGTTGTGGTGTGGTHTGGTTGTGGTGTGGTHTGGTTGTGGTAGASATGGTAGSSATGGAGGAGGATATGGAGGAGGAGGVSNTDGGVQQYAALSYTFDTTTQGFALNNYNGAGNLVNVDGGTPPTQTWDGTTGSPNTTPKGSLKIAATFTGYNQFVLSTLNISPLVDATGKTIHAWVMVDSIDGGSNFGGGAQLQVNSTSAYHGAYGGIVTLTPGTWKELTLDLSSQASPFDASQLIQISINFTTGAGPDGGVFGAPVHAVFHVDTISDGSGNPPPPAIDHTFDKTAESYVLASTLQVPDGGTAASVAWDGTVGNPSGGSLKVVVPFTAYNQNVSVQTNISPPANISGKMLHAKIRLDSGTFSAGYVQLHVSAPDYSHYVTGATVGALVAGTWTDLVLNPASITAAGFDPTQVIQVGVQIGTGAGPDGGTFPTTTPLVFHIDSIVAQ